MRLTRWTAVSVVLTLAAAGAGMAADKTSTTTSTTITTTTTTTTTSKPSSGIEFDNSVSACVDFNQYVNGTWLKKNPIPPAYPGWGVANVLQESNRDQLKAILEDAAKSNSKAGTNEQKVADYYASCMDEKAIEAQGLKPLQSELDRINNMSSPAAVQAEIFRLHSMGLSPLFGSGSEQDLKNSEEVIFSVGQGGLGLPDRDYYFKDDARTKDIRDKYVAYVQHIFELSGDSPETAATRAKNVLAFETKLAAASLTRVQQRDPDLIYHRMSVDDASKMAPSFQWKTLLQTVGLPNVNSIDVGMPDFFKEVDKDLTAVSLDDWKSYLKFSLINSAAPSLSTPFVDANFDFYSRTLRGTKEQLPRWKRCVSATDRALGEALGQVYVKTAFPPAAKAKMIDMVNNLSDALGSDIKGLGWMKDTTKSQAIAKLNAFQRKIGYPDKWRDYSSLSVDRGPYVQNQLRARQFEQNRDIAKVGKPVDRTEWGMTPPTVNAYYNPSQNEIVFPAGILQPPYFDPNRDDAYNYGAAGSIIGHEMTHGFDDEGSKFDAKGNLANWWDETDLKAFQKQAECIQKQFDEYKVGDVTENGKLVSGESIADLAGLKIAFAAYMKSQQGKPRQIIDGLTPEQRFFGGFARGWAGQSTPEAERLQATTNEHPLGRFRANGTLSNMPEFATAFGCKAGDPMVRPADKQCVVW